MVLLVSKFTSHARCDPEWGGEYCDEPVLPLPSQLKDSFSRAPSLSHWHVLTGGKLSSVCGAVASGAALHFSGVGPPVLEILLRCEGWMGPCPWLCRSHLTAELELTSHHRLHGVHWQNHSIHSRRVQRILFGLLCDKSLWLASYIWLRLICIVMYYAVHHNKDFAQKGLCEIC